MGGFVGYEVGRARRRFCLETMWVAFTCLQVTYCRRPTFSEEIDDISRKPHQNELLKGDVSEAVKLTVWPNYGLSSGLKEQDARARGKAAMVLVLLAKRCG